MRHLPRLLSLAFLLLGLVGCDALTRDNAAAKPKRTPRLHGGGSSFVNPMMQRWCADYQKEKSGKVNYQSVGSGAGIQHMTGKTFDFGCSDNPMTDAQIKKAMEVGGEAVHIPLCMGAVVVAYNLPEVEQPIRFTPQILADIYLGKITNWNDPELKKINPSVEFPDQELSVVHRSDNSGTTFVFTEYLTKVSPLWAKQVGTGQAVKWRCGTGQKGNEGVSAHIVATKGSIGYTELTYAMQNKLKTGLIQNREGAFIRPSLESVTAAAVGALREIPDDLRYSLTNVLGKDSYPISGSVWAIVYVAQRGDKGQAVVDFLRWTTHEGQERCEELHYARLPPGLIERIDQRLNQIKVSQSAP